MSELRVSYIISNFLYFKFPTYFVQVSVVSVSVMIIRIRMYMYTIVYVYLQFARLNGRWAGHLARRNDNRLAGQSRDGDDYSPMVRYAQDRKHWRNKEEVYAQQRVLEAVS